MAAEESPNVAPPAYACRSCISLCVCSTPFCRARRTLTHSRRRPVIGIDSDQRSILLQRARPAPCVAAKAPAPGGEVYSAHGQPFRTPLPHAAVRARLGRDRRCKHPGRIGRRGAGREHACGELPRNAVRGKSEIQDRAGSSLLRRDRRAAATGGPRGGSHLAAQRAWRDRAMRPRGGACRGGDHGRVFGDWRRRCRARAHAARKRAPPWRARDRAQLSWIDAAGVGAERHVCARQPAARIAGPDLAVGRCVHSDAGLGASEQRGLLERGVARRFDRHRLWRNHRLPGRGSEDPAHPAVHRGCARRPAFRLGAARRRARQAGDPDESRAPPCGIARGDVAYRSDRRSGRCIQCGRQAHRRGARHDDRPAGSRRACARRARAPAGRPTRGRHQRRRPGRDGRGPRRRPRHPARRTLPADDRDAEAGAATQLVARQSAGPDRRCGRGPLSRRGVGMPGRRKR